MRDAQRPRVQCARPDVPAAARNGVVHGELRRLDLVSTSHTAGVRQDARGVLKQHQFGVGGGRRGRRGRVHHVGAGH